MTDKKQETHFVGLPVKSEKKKKYYAFGSTMQEYRVKAKLEQSQVGAVCGVSANAVSNWERDLSRPDISLVPTLCRLYNISLYDFYRMENPNPIAAEEKKMLSDYRSLTVANKKLFRKTIDAIMDSQEETRWENYRRDYCLLVTHDTCLAAGVGNPLDEEPESYPIFVRTNSQARRADDVFPVNGESMEPVYPNGSMVYVERVEPSILVYGDIVACIVNGTPFVKQYEKDGLHSTNKKFPVIAISDDDSVRLIGRVIGMVDPDDFVPENITRELMQAFADELEKIG